jgi:hypothetical protein
VNISDVSVYFTVPGYPMAKFPHPASAINGVDCVFIPQSPANGMEPGIGSFMEK